MLVARFLLPGAKSPQNKKWPKEVKNENGQKVKNLKDKTNLIETLLIKLVLLQICPPRYYSINPITSKPANSPKITQIKKQSATLYKVQFVTLLQKPL